MITRIVKLSFKKENIDSFKKLFATKREAIRNFQGCNFLELYQDREDPSVFFTYSRWADESDLEAYRQSDFFRTVWGTTREWFDEKPQAWSVDVLHTLN